MTPMEEQLSTLLQEAPDEPLNPIDVDALLSHRRRRRLLAPAVAAAAVVAVAVPVAVALSHGDSSSRTPVAIPTRPGTAHLPQDPHQGAIRTAEAWLRAATVLPGAREVSDQPTHTLRRAPSTLGSQTLVQRTEFWTAPGTVHAAIGYLRAHPPAGFEVSGWSPRSLYLSRLTAKEDSPMADSSLQYSVAAFHGGVAVRADAQVPWAPRRSPADMVPSSMTSVDILIVRQNRDAPTVHRTLTGAAAVRLADAANRLPRVWANCVGGPAIGGHDRLVFHTASETVRVRVDVSDTCAPVVLWAGHRSPIQLEGNWKLNGVVLRELGLPANYGGR